MKRLIAAALLILMLTTIASCGKSEGDIDAGGVNAATAAADAAAGEGAADDAGPFASLKSLDLDGNPVTGDIFAEAKLTMVNVWGTFCGPCIEEMPDLAKLHEDYADRGFQIFGIISDVTSRDGEKVDSKNVDKAREIIATAGVGYKNAVLTENVYNLCVKDVIGVPTSYFVDSDGNQVGKAYIGARDYDEWAEIIESLLEEVQ